LKLISKSCDLRKNLTKIMKKFKNCGLEKPHKHMGNKEKKGGYEVLIAYV